MDFGEYRKTFDIDYQQQLKPMGQHNIIWGFGNRLSMDKMHNTSQITFNVPSRTYNLVNAFLQDEMALVPGKARLMFGSKIEHNNWTGLNVQPGIRFAYTPDSRHTIWSSVSRAVRTPSRVELEDADMMMWRKNMSNTPGGWGYTPDPDKYPKRPALPKGLDPGFDYLTVGYTLGNPDPQNEELLACELGYRAQPASNMSIDMSTYYNIYDHIVGNSPMDGYWVSVPRGQPGAPGYWRYDTYVDNKSAGSVHGAELLANWNVSDKWRLVFSKSWINMNIHHAEPDLIDANLEITSTEYIWRRSPAMQYNIRSYFDLPANLEFDVALYHVGGQPGMQEAGYNRLDLRLGWTPKKDFEVSMGVRDLGSAVRREFGRVLCERQVMIQNSAYVTLTSRF
jgi:iron complex outermembrane receptor protein